MAWLRAFGSWLPTRRVGNAELAPLVDATPEWMLDVTGIEERRYAAEEDTVHGIGILAAQDCLRNAGVAAPELGLILAASGSSDRFCPGPASQIAAGLGLSATPALDIPVASAGSLIGLILADRLAPSLGRVLVVGSEIMSRRVTASPENKNTAILFGDGAGACLVDPEAGFARIAGHSLFTDGGAAEILTVQDGRFEMDGQAVILHASRKLPRAINELLARHEIPAAEVEAFLLHQANLNLIARVAAAVKVPRERFFTNIARYGNTSSASLLIAAAEWRQKQEDPSRAKDPRGPILFSAFGAGLNWGALLALPQG